jgi:hypothetical protein
VVQEENRGFGCILTHPGCQIEDLSPKCCSSVHQRYKLDSILPSVEASNGNLKCLRLSGWDLSQHLAESLLDVLRKCPHIEKVDLDRRRLSFAPDNTHFLVRLIELGTLKNLRLHVGGDESSRYEERHCLEMDRVLQQGSLPKSPKLESLTLECMNLSITQGGSLLQSVVELPSLRYLKIINLPSKVVPLNNPDEKSNFLEIVTKPTNLRRLILTGVGSSFFVDRPTDEARRGKRRAWLQVMMSTNRQLHYFGPTVARQIQEDSHLQTLADDNRFSGMLLVGKQYQFPSPRLWPYIFARAVESLQDDPGRLAGALWRLLVKSNGCLFSETRGPTTK